MKGFRDFVLRGNVVDLAVAVLVGAAFSAVVTAFTEDLLTPLLGALGGAPDFSRFSATLGGSRFLVGDFVNAVIAFLLTAAVLYLLVVVPTGRLADRRKVETAPVAAVRECPECLSKIPAAARRCSFCTSEVAPA